MWLHDVVWKGLIQSITQVLYIGAPFFLVGLLLNRLERIVQGRMVERFGWRSILWTGWIGTPVHELSHAVMCPLFFHRITKMALFQPDPESGRLGYVHHAYRKTSLYQVAGNFFIGMAPLLGGAVVLYLILLAFDPGAAKHALASDRVSSAVAGGNLFTAAKAIFGQAIDLLTHLITVKNLGSIAFWVFIYLVLCVGSHVAPSRADTRGARTGGLLLLGLLLVFNILFLAFGGKPGTVTGGLASVLGPALGLFILAALLCSLSTLAIVGLTGLLGGSR